LNGNFRTAFEFRASALRKQRRKHQSEPDGGDVSIDDEFATQLGLWSSASDFWSTIGWAFHCSAAHPRRWRYWKLWLEFMLDVMGADWKQRHDMDVRRHSNGDMDDKKEFTACNESILAMYINSLRSERKNPLREIQRAVLAFADGTMKDAALYREIFTHETAELVEKKRKRPALDLEHNHFGDYLDNDEDYDFGNGIEADWDDQETPDKRKPRARKRRRRPSLPKWDLEEQSQEVVVGAGLEESVSLRLRLFALLSRAALCLPNPYTSVEELYDSFGIAISRLPLQMFRLFVASSSTIAGDIEVYVTMLRYTIRPLLPSHAPTPKPRLTDTHTTVEMGISMRLICRSFLPFASSRIFAQDNAKLSLCIEHMLRILWTSGAAPWHPNLRGLLEKGITARQEQASRKGRGKPLFSESHPEVYAKKILDASSRNLRFVVDLIEADRPSASKS
jgi:hypothetical protein